MSKTQAVSDSTTLPDPEMLLMQVSIDTQQKEIGMQQSFATLLGLQSAAATNSLNIAQGIASYYATNTLEKAPSSSAPTDNAIYNTMMTQISDLTNKYQTIEQGGATIATSLNQSQAQILQLTQIVVDFLSSMGQLITMFAN